MPTTTLTQTFTTQVQTLTLSKGTTRKRGLSLSLLSRARFSFLHDLPAEIIIHILELALLNHRPRDLALISQFIRQFVNLIIYRTVALDSPHAISLFHRTASSPRSSHLLTQVKRLAVIWEPEYFTSSTERQLREIMSHCSSLRVVAVPSCCQINISPIGIFVQEGPADITVQSFEGLTNSTSSSMSSLPDYFSTSLTHLRICEPSDTWQSPLSIIAAFKDAPNLTHLQLARRADSNVDNDLVFVEDIASLLSTRKNLKLVVVTIFEPLWRASSNALCESNIWMLASKLQEMDSRVTIMEGGLGSWREEWKDVKGFRCGGHPTNFWNTVQQKHQITQDSIA